jgi:hypothetical protein
MRERSGQGGGARSFHLHQIYTRGAHCTNIGVESKADFEFVIGGK